MDNNPVSSSAGAQQRGGSPPVDGSTVDSGSQEELGGLGNYLRGRFEELVGERFLAEQEWLRSLRQYLGIYDEDDGGENSAEVTNYKGSRAFIRLTRSKVRAMDARTRNILFPGGAEKNWKVEPTPKPEFPETLLTQIKLKAAAGKLLQLNQDLQKVSDVDLQLMQSNGELPDLRSIQAQIQAGEVPKELEPKPFELEQLVQEEAKRRSDAMEAEIADQLEECRFPAEVKKVLHSGHLFGTGFLKGPLAEEKSRSIWFFKENQWVLERDLEFLPTAEFVPIWDLYPDSIDIPTIEQLEGMFQRYVMTKAQVRALKRQPGFDKAVINEYLDTHQKGDADRYQYFENELRMLRKEDQGTVNSSRPRRYEVIEWTGYADAALLEQVGVPLPGRTPAPAEGEEPSPDAAAPPAANPEDAEYKANVWILGNKVIKATLSLYDDDTVQTYHCYRMEDSDTGLYGIGIPEIMRDTQRMFNAAIRALLDNMGLSSAPMFDVNVDLLTPDELLHLDEIVARRVWTRTGKGPEAQYPAVRAIPIPQVTAPFIELAKLALDLTDEATSIPRYVTGNEKISGAGQTYGGLSLLMNSADVMTKEAVSNYDDGITKSFLRSMYHWNMQFNKKDDIKGDFDMVPTASTALAVKEQQAIKLDQLAASTLNPIDAPLMKRLELLRQRVRARDIDPDKLVVTDDELQTQMDQEQQQLDEAATQTGTGNPMPNRRLAA